MFVNLSNNISPLCDIIKIFSLDILLIILKSIISQIESEEMPPDEIEEIAMVKFLHEEDDFEEDDFEEDDFEKELD